MNTTIKRCLEGIALLGLAIVCATSQAGTIEIQFLGLDLTYDGVTTNSITDASSGPDALTSVTVAENGVPVAGSPFSSDIGIDLSIPGVEDIAVGGDVVTSSAGGSLELSLPGGDSLSLTLSEATIAFTDLGFVQITTGISAADIDGQSLPGGLIIGSPVTVSFITSISSLTDDTVNLLSFSGNSTGTIEGVSIPEPASAALLVAIGLLGGFRTRRRN